MAHAGPHIDGGLGIGRHIDHRAATDRELRDQGCFFDRQLLRQKESAVKVCAGERRKRLLRRVHERGRRGPERAPLVERHPVLFWKCLALFFAALAALLAILLASR